MIYGYIRVSTDKQTVENQRFEIKKFAKNQGFVIGEWIEETISGTKRIEDRLLGEYLKKMEKDDMIISTELSRLGRSMFMIITALSKCLERGINVWTIKDNYRLGNDISSKCIAFSFGIMAELEHHLISLRTTEALSRLRANGIKLGRPVGSVSLARKARGREKELKKYLDLNISIRKIAVQMKLSRYLVARMIDNLREKLGEEFTYVNNMSASVKSRYSAA